MISQFLNKLTSAEFIVYYVYLGCLLIFLVVIKIMANIYIAKKRQFFFNSCTLSEPCKNMGNVVACEYSTYINYMQSLGLNKSHNCSLSVVKGAENNPIKYLIKYSNIEKNMENVEQLDFCLRFLTGYYDFIDISKQLRKEICKKIPLFYKPFVSKKYLPFKVCGFTKHICSFKPLKKFTFLYQSAGGRSSSCLKIRITPEVLAELKKCVMGSISRTGHAKTQRSAMTSDLRDAIKKRDNYTCQLCGNSVYNEPNLLLEVDHIVPVSKGGKTEADNLQTLCWKCNRGKRDYTYAIDSDETENEDI